ncbi:hypothetical protein Ana3638_09920 [Anaerocolumna sedimenticola]|uniref:BIG2 domain-containing protein n=1 Tax=Anaerocolumna sedimenticola TaxID=2696063 RepID=A0A6P1TMG1_9FIRM|nr:Ig-like domain-containing protein [Anaerocolumna sedimenticola]QHQ61046.1 hypothetical protein Ana3638_09920 [Anaerocolumna sedimenticola]
MRKNFFKKKLATTVALAMVVASLTVPSSAQAAVATKIVKQGGAAAPTVLYVGDKGTDYGLSKTFKGNTYAWTTSNSAIATISKAGVVTAKAPGTVTIKCTARDSKGKWLKAFTQKLTINLRATSIDVNAEDFELAMGESKDLNAVKTPAKSTDAVRYYSDNTAVATVDAKTGVVKAVGVGEATITVYSKATYKSATASKYNKTDSVKVTVKDGIQAVKQTVSNALEVTFATDQSGKVTDSNLVITDADGVKQTIDDISFSSDGKTATVKTYLDFEDGVVYKVAYDNTEKSFTASVGAPTSVVLKAKTVQYDKATDLDYAAYDKNGVDVSSKVDWEDDVDFDYEDSDAEIEWNSDDSVYEITVFDYPKSVDVEMTYDYYDEDKNDNTEFTSKATIKSVEELASTASNLEYTLSDDDSYTDIDWEDDLNSTIPADADSYRLFIKGENQDGDDIYEWNFDKFVSTNDDIITVSYDQDDKDVKGNPVYVYPVKAGTAYIKATYGDTSKTFKVVVGDEPEAKSISVDDSTIELYDSFLGDENGTEVELTVKDQYGNEVNYDDFDDIEEPEHRSGSSADIISTRITDDNKVLFYLSDDCDKNVKGMKEGNNTYRIDIAGKTASVTVKVVDVNMANDTVKRVELIGADTSKDVKVDTSKTDVDDVLKDVKFTVYGINSDGDRIPMAAGTNYEFSLTLDGDKLANSAKYAEKGFAFNSAANVATFAAVSYNDETGVVSQAAVGTYKIKVVAKTAGGSTIDDATTSLKVTNTQSAASVSQDKTTVDVNDFDGTIKGLIGEAFSFDYKDMDLDEDDLYSAQVVIGNTKYDNEPDTLAEDVAAGKSVQVKKITLKINSGNGYSILVDKDVNKNVKVTD